MKIVDLTQRTPAWHRWRSEGMSASDAPVLFDCSPYKTRWRLWAEKTGLVLAEDLSANPHVQRGIKLEPEARKAFENKYRTLLLPLCAEADVNPYLRASFDGLNDAGEPVELKCPSTSVFEEVEADRTNSSAYQLYVHQVQFQILVADSQRGWLAFYHDGKLLDFEVTRDEKIIAKLRAEAETFWHQIQTLQEPAKDPARDLFVPAKQQRQTWEDLVKRYRVVKQKADQLDEQLKQTKQRALEIQTSLIQQMGDFAHTEFGGIKLTRYWAKGALDYGQLIQDHLPLFGDTELNRYRKPAQERVKITVKPTSDTTSLNTQTSPLATAAFTTGTQSQVNHPSHFQNQSEKPTAPPSFYF